MRSRPAFDKVERCLEQAKKDGFEWLWMDTYVILVILYESYLNANFLIVAA